MKTPQECCEKWMKLRGLAMYSPQMEEAMKLFLEWYEDGGDVAEPTDEEVDRIARVLCNADAHDEPHEDSWRTMPETDRRHYKHMARAAYAHIGAEVANLREQVNGLCEIDMNAMAALSEVVGLRQELKQARAERRTRPAKVRFDCTAEDAAKEMQCMKHVIRNVYCEWDDLGENYKDDFRKAFDMFLPFLASRAVIEVPADVPSAVDIWDAYLKSGKANEVALVDWILPYLAPWLQPRTVTAEQVEQAARAARQDSSMGCNWPDAVAQMHWEVGIRAAFAAAGFNVEGE